MKYISTKNIYLAWVIALLATISVVLALTISHWFFVAVIFFVVCYEIFSSKVLRCPNCNRAYSLIKLTYSLSHPYQCNCGNRIAIHKENNSNEAEQER